MAHLMLYGTGGWTQRWRIPDGQVEHVRGEIDRVGKEGTGRIPVVDAATDGTTTLVVSWAAIAAAVILDDEPGGSRTQPGPYA